MIGNQAGMLPQGQQGMFAPPNAFGGPGPFALMIPTQMGYIIPDQALSELECSFLLGFDVAEGHTSDTCPMEWCKPNHQVGYTREHSAAYAAYAPCTKGHHKTQFPKVLFLAAI